MDVIPSVAIIRLRIIAKSRNLLQNTLLANFMRSFDFAHFAIAKYAPLRMTISIILDFSSITRCYLNS
jgi:hypothetical protein